MLADDTNRGQSTRSPRPHGAAREKPGVGDGSNDGSSDYEDSRTTRRNPGRRHARSLWSRSLTRAMLLIRPFCSQELFSHWHPLHRLHRNGLLQLRRLLRLPYWLHEHLQLHWHVLVLQLGTSSLRPSSLIARFSKVLTDALVCAAGSIAALLNLVACILWHPSSIQKRCAVAAVTYVYNVNNAVTT